MKQRARKKSWNTYNYKSPRPETPPASNKHIAWVLIPTSAPSKQKLHSGIDKAQFRNYVIEKNQFLNSENSISELRKLQWHTQIKHHSRLWVQAIDARRKGRTEDCNGDRCAQGVKEEIDSSKLKGTNTTQYRYRAGRIAMVSRGFWVSRKFYKNQHNLININQYKST